MDDLTSYIFDLSQNAFNAKSSYLKITIDKKTSYRLSIIDHGKGIKKSDLIKISSPFYTTRTTRDVGLGIPLMLLLCEQTDGSHEFKSIRHIGTRLTFILNHHHLDFPKEGDYGMMVADLVMHQDLKKLVFKYTCHGQTYMYKYKKNKQTKKRKELIQEINTHINRIEGRL
ncbi:MAG: ATP-binding protein [Acholeplasmataceae bacterium]